MPATPSGKVDLIVSLGTIDAGETGIRGRRRQSVR
ncbi:hypothetical protein E0H22_13590 [Rhodopseudomonas boonkerdii]|nr:filamentous hemagglutinin family protein [Rhodopseudomonas boonkerdii]UGV26628.1 hypothetical protein E0H22_13590 [Rhodopseudomonas boonkerdii]